MYAQTCRKNRFFLLPISPLRVYKVNKAFLNAIYRLIQSPIKKILMNNLWRKTISTTNPDDRFLILQDLEFGSSKKSKLDIYYIGNPIAPAQIRNGPVKPVIVFIHGGAWSNGNKRIYRIMARTLVELGYMVVIPDYIKFPKASATEMVTDVSLAIQWTVQNISLVRY